MRSLMVLAALLGMVVSLQAKEADSSRAVRSPEATVKQLVSDQSGQPAGKPARTRSDGRKNRDFSAEIIVPDICTGC
ncbi:hypothetical protein CI1B_43960 [Bradyrhizobium ivorense]|uniref:Uncharacterized protein n=2 Tax=Bradyrhizobium TaxID=374 RepID=A0A508TD93_9BRAD|nr:hypothetical protein [Bradyrhizobium ivorense]QOZ26732.1 hypothetical protein XH93_26300 [Bradyrhizobium sp. CCBAU 51753]VIO72749.1 hypothetical protein CI1B_43960 [Bradyrhizobium ivorense]